MRCHAHVLTVTFLATAFTATISASQPSRSATFAQAAPKSTWAPDKKNPYSKLFVPARQPATQAAPARPAAGVAGKPEIKCGMTVIPADPSIDPRIAIAPRPPDGTRFTIRAIDPAICR